ncbi:MAG: HEAT repeat domain-containing protein [bacterium]
MLKFKKVNGSGFPFDLQGEGMAYIMSHAWYGWCVKVFSEDKIITNQLIEMMIDASQDWEAEIRMMAGLILGMACNPRAEEALIRLAGDPNEWIRAVAAYGLGKIPSREGLLAVNRIIYRGGAPPVLDEAVRAHTKIAKYLDGQLSIKSSIVVQAYSSV